MGIGAHCCYWLSVFCCLLLSSPAAVWRLYLVAVAADTRRCGEGEPLSSRSKSRTHTRLCGAKALRTKFSHSRAAAHGTAWSLCNLKTTNPACCTIRLPSTPATATSQREGVGRTKMLMFEPNINNNRTLLVNQSSAVRDIFHFFCSHRFSCLAEELADAFYGHFHEGPLGLHRRHPQWTMPLYGTVEILLYLCCGA